METHPEPSAAQATTTGAEDGLVRVYLLDDHEIVRRGLRELLEGDGRIEVVGESGLAEEATRRIPALRPHVAVLDGRLPDGSGVDVCRDIRSVDPSIACLILTSYDDDEALFHAIMAGASGYVLDPQVTARVLERLRGGHDEDAALAGLTEQERRVLMHIADGLTNRQIGQEMFLAEKTVKNYVSSILAKLGMERRTQAAVFASKLREKPS
jgi:DNA-binding NarL/FixJ family response regulator